MEDKTSTSGHMKAISNSRDCPNCGSNHKSKPFCVYDNGWHCFSCGASKTIDTGFSIRDSRIKNIREDIPEFPEAYSEFSRFSVEAQLWLTQYDITETDVREYDIYYYPGDNSLIFAIFDQNMLVFYQKRNMRQRCITTYGNKQPKMFLNNTSNILIIVEDYISAIKVHQSGYNSVCLFGTKVDYALLEQWFILYDNIIVWLDNDSQKEVNSGQEAAKIITDRGNKILKHKYGFSECKNIVNVVADQDPKCYLNTEIREFIRGALNG